MTQFITVSLILDALKNERGSNSASGARMEAAPTFREWKTGFIVKHKNDSSISYKIEQISDGETTGYQSQVELVNVDDDTDKRTLRGGTLQSSYVFVGRGDVPMAPEEVKKTTKPMTIAVSSIKTFSPRTKGRPGSRIVLDSGVSYPCVEDHDTILARITPPAVPAA